VKRWVLIILLLGFMFGASMIALVCYSIAFEPPSSLLHDDRVLTGGRNFIAREAVSGWEVYNPGDARVIYFNGRLGYPRWLPFAVVNYRVKTVLVHGGLGPRPPAGKDLRRALVDRIEREGYDLDDCEGIPLPDYYILSVSWFGIIANSLVLSLGGVVILLSPVHVARVIRQAARRRRGRCPNCGYDLRGQPPEVGAGGGCPECGWNRQPEATT